MRSNLPGQFDLPNTAPDHAGLAKQLAAAPLRPVAPQLPADHGLFGDESNQLDLIEMFMD